MSKQIWKFWCQKRNMKGFHVGVLNRDVTSQRSRIRMSRNLRSNINVSRIVEKRLFGYCIGFTPLCMPFTRSISLASCAQSIQFSSSENALRDASLSTRLIARPWDGLMVELRWLDVREVFDLGQRNWRSRSRENRAYSQKTRMLETLKLTNSGSMLCFRADSSCCVHQNLD